jgi:hypothetical protein
VWRGLLESRPTFENTMFDRFTDRAKKTMSLARQEALRIGHGHIGPEHLLLGLVQEGSGVAANVLKNMNVDLETIRCEVDKILAPKGPPMDHTIQLPFTPRGKKVLELSLEESMQLCHNYIGTEHLLLGLIREEESIPAQVLRKLGVELDDFREEVLEFLAPSDSDDAADAAMAQARSRADLFGRFTESGRKAMDFTRREALKLNHDYICTEHILLGLVQEDRGVAASVLKSMNVGLESVRRELEKIVKAGPSPVTMGQLPFTPRAKRALELALEEASELRHDYFGTEHLLLGLIRESEGVAAQVLSNLGVQLETIRKQADEHRDMAAEVLQTGRQQQHDLAGERFTAEVLRLERREVEAFLPGTQVNVERGFGFVMIPRGERFDELYRTAIEPALRAAGMHRVSRSSEGATLQYPEVMKSIVHADVLVAVTTGSDPDVLYQVGLCHGMRRSPFVLLEREQHAHSGAGSPTLRYDDNAEGHAQLAELLAARIRNRRR